jgi:hypothetical protein
MDDVISFVHESHLAHPAHLPRKDLKGPKSSLCLSVFVVCLLGELRVLAVNEETGTGRDGAVFAEGCAEPRERDIENFVLRSSLDHVRKGVAPMRVFISSARERFFGGNNAGGVGLRNSILRD